MSRLETRQLEDQLSEQIGNNVEIAGHLSEIAEAAHERRLEAMLDDVTEEYVPEDETVRDVDIRFNPWCRPKVTVWCRANGFSHENNQVHDGRFMVNGDLFRYSVDVRPF